jgi:hypothetical protein
LLEKFLLKQHEGKKQYSVWQEGNHLEELYSDRFIDQKQSYIHMNPVKAGIVNRPEDYAWSSANEEIPIRVLPLS